MTSRARGLRPAIRTGLDWLSRGQLLLYCVEALEDLLPRLWLLAFRARPLSSEEISASREVHPEGMIPYNRVLVTENSLLSRIGGNRAMTTMYVLHCPRGGWDLAIVVHELTHVAQYRRAGLVYIPQALYAQVFGGGYDYGDLLAARAAGKHFAGFNREQQAQMVQDYYLLLHGLRPWYKATLEALEPYVAEMRRGEF